MRHVPVPTREELGEAEWILAAAETVINPVSFKQLNQTAEYLRSNCMNKKVYVANLPSQTTEAELRALFAKAGSVMSVKIVQDRQTGQPRGIAFLEMSTQWEGRRTASMLNRQDFMGKYLLVKEATDKRGFRGR
jgi:RNA recognition motif-containing protein